ncbi:ABC transporter ATP-binding protein [Pendulispora albinea]|uniref:ABC transporter ATP-binding protein n=1 Tax=Pendulispora albinea TaxID=2741071 RepID=A0ABZ2M7M7_9BACT
MSLLTVRALNAGYGPIQILRGVDLDVAVGGVTAVLGANGAGKTTLLRALCAMIERDGEIRFDGARIDRVRTEDLVRIGIAHVPEGRGTFANLTTEENLRLGAYTRHDRDGIARDLERMYRHFPRLQQRRAQQAGTLSGGEQQMLALGRALMLRPKLMVLDEPSFGLAPLAVKEVYSILERINGEEGVSILVVEQYAAIALDLADHVCLLETGRVVMSGSPRDLRRDESIRRAYLGY